MSEPNFPTLIQALQNPSLYDHEVQNFQVLETHISWILLTGPYAYKIKKPVNVGFLDFSTLDQRRFFCEEELRLNQRLAPEFYVELVTITGAPQSPRLNNTGESIEYAVKMRQFPQEALLSRRIQRGQVSKSHIDELAATIAEFHAHVAVVDPASAFGTSDLIRQTILENFEHLPRAMSGLISREEVERLKRWTECEHSRHLDDFRERKKKGFVRECHGDLHLGNIALVDEQLVIFDCIEFSERFRWIDVISEVAFVVMDLIDRDAPRLGWRLLNHYLELTGDYEGINTFRYYLTYRAMVRAKVTGIRLAQQEPEDSEYAALEEELTQYLALATSFTKPPHPVLLITHGLSGSGKTTVSQTLLESLGAIRIRSDIERQRLFGVSPEERTHAGKSPFIYSKDSTEATYDRLEKLARQVLRSGFSVIVDATFLKRTHREAFRQFANDLGVPFCILDIHASEATLRVRIEKRLQEGRDASEADISVLEGQLSHDEPFSPTERPHVLTINTEQRESLDKTLKVIHSMMNASSP
ncbi:MAG: AAA family ATPase [Nitrospirales bacterium]|nr:AAA family ATPase [Nitrospira sp.]MDR4500955.1 AAA family ATPase [Nitrospirales bacterium]